MNIEEKELISNLLYKEDMAVSPYERLDIMEQLSEVILGITSDIRAELSYKNDEPLTKYYVYDNENRGVLKDCLVLNPETEQDRKSIKHYIRGVKDKALQEKLILWLELYDELEEDSIE